MANIFQCHYMRASLFKLNAHFHSSKHNLKYESFVEQFSHIDVGSKLFFTYLKRFIDWTRKKKICTAEKTIFMDTFDIQKWNKLDPDNKKLHTFNDCKPCKLISYNKPII